MRTCVELGHALGNQHWPALVKGAKVYVPLTVDRKVMASVMKTHRFENIAYDFAPGAEIVPYLAPHELRRLFGGAEGPVHSHAHAHETRDHAHPHDDVRVRTSVHGRRSPGNEDAARCGARALLAVRRAGVSDRRLRLFRTASNSAIQQRVVTDAATLLAFARTATEQAATGDGVALIHAQRAAREGDLDEVARIDARVLARKLSSENRTMSTRMGRKAAELERR